MTFKDYLISRKIDPSGFAKNEPKRYREFGLLYDQVHIKSFVMQKLFILNSLRIKYPCTLTETETAGTGERKVLSAKLKRPAMSKPATVRSSKPVMKSAAAPPSEPEIKSEQGLDKSKMAGKRPVMKPKVRPQQKTDERPGESGTKPKNVGKRPVMKPKIRPQQKTDEHPEETDTNPKKVGKRPVIKPKIKPQQKTDQDSGASETKSEKPRPKIQPRPIIKKK